MIEKVIIKINKYKSTILKRSIAKLCFRSGVLSSLYYFIFDYSFQREQKATLAGLVKHLEDAKLLKANYYLVVRNVHRIEKGLLMRPKRSVYAKDYIKETIDSFEGVWKDSSNSNNPQIQWFHDVLLEYFQEAKVDEDIAKQYDKFLNIIENPYNFKKNIKAIPYVRKSSEMTSIEYEEFYKLTRQRRSVRWFEEKKVPRELIHKALVVANQSPSACNRQPFYFHIIDETKLLNDIVNFPMGTAGYSKSIQVLVVIVGNLDAYFDERDRHVIYIDASLAAMSFILALETLGLGSCVINWPDIEEREKKMEAFLKLEAHQRPIMCIGLGYPDPNGLIAFSEKKEINKLVKYNI